LLHTAGLIKTMIANVQAAIAYVKRSAQQLPKIDRWRVLPGYICEGITRHRIAFPIKSTRGRVGNCGFRLMYSAATARATVNVGRIAY